MGSILPEELLLSLVQQWPCRDLQIKHLLALLGPELPSPPAIFVHGPQASGKSIITRAILNGYETKRPPDPPVEKKGARKGKKTKEAVQNSQDDFGPRSYTLTSVINVAECITARDLLSKIVSGLISAIQRAGAQIFHQGAEDEWLTIVQKARCEHVSTLPQLLCDILGKTKCKKYILLLDGIDELREGGQMLLAALARCGETVSSLCVLFVSRFTPRPLFLQVAGVPHVYFAPYTRDELISILSVLPPPPVSELSEKLVETLYPKFLTTLYDSLIGPVAGTVPVFRSASEKLWPRFVLPILNGEKAPGGDWDFSRLLVKNRALFQQQGEQALVHSILSDSTHLNDGIQSTVKKSKHQFPTLPYLPTLVLTAAFLAAYIPQRLDTIYFSKFTTSKKKKIRRRGNLKLISQMQSQDQDDREEDLSQTPTKSRKKSAGQPRVNKSTPASSTQLGNRKNITNFLTPRPFSLERLLAIYHAIDPDPPVKQFPVADAIAPEIATLQRLRLVVPASAAAATSGGVIDGGEKWCLNINITVSSSDSVNEAWIVEMARGIGVDIEEYISGD